ncbi:protein Jumonji-like isoform X2 [Dendronephthya gigantea]|uniref:protein Jumonji-like isoform X2 n=1 Tax=Dendronephthya gigantea TaxID=151771 RepID=UPI00106AFAF6|nr:protein Jumonji-like isoform X2 [Dendronephthya gigantea]
MHRPKRRIISRSLEYNNGMLHEEEIALRRALHASLNASKTVDNEEEYKDSSDDSSLASFKKQGTKSNLGASGIDEGSQRNKRECDESVGSNDKKRQKKLLVRIKPKHRKRKGLGNAASKDIGKKKVTKSKILAVKEDDRRVIKRRRRKKNVDQMIDDRNMKSNESLPKVHVQRKFPQTSPASPRSLLLFQSQMQPMTTRAKTEDFLDFLCLRGSTQMPKYLEMFNNPCAPVSPLTDEDESCKTASSKTSANEEKNDNEPDVKQNLITQLEESATSTSSPSLLVSSPVSTRVQSHTILPQFTSNHDVLTHIPTPIPYPTPPTPAKQPGFDVYGAPSTTRVAPSLVPNQPRVSSMVTETHMSPHMSPGERHGFHPVSQSGPVDKETLIRISPHKVDESGGKLLKSPKESPNNKKGKLPNKQQDIIPNKLSKEGLIGSPNTAKKSKRRSLNFESIPMDSIPDGCQDPVRGGQSQSNYVPIFKPTEIEFKNPLKYIESIKPKAEGFGICVIAPPDTWQPEYCLSDEIRFTTKLQRIHCLGKSYPTVEDELAAIKQHLEQQGILLSAMPQIAGCEVDLPLMSSVVEEFGGLQQIIDKRKWTKVADKLQIPKTAVDRITKLEHIYCKYLLSYDMLSKEERTKLRADEENKRKEDSGSSKTKQEFMTKGRSMSLAIFQRNAKNVNEFYMKHTDITKIEDVFWQMTDEGRRYVVVHSAMLDGTAFPTSKTKPFYKSKWNLNVLPRVPGSLARDLPDVEGVTSPVVKVEMVLSTETWHPPAHDMLILEYLHQGENKIWYSVPQHSKDRFLEAVKTELNGDIDRMKDRAISRSSLIKSGIPVYKVAQEPGQFIVKFPQAYHSSLSTGFCVSEYVTFAPLSYVPRIKTTFQGDLKSEVDHLFSWECFIVSSMKEELRRNSCEETLNILIPELKELRDVETRLQSELSNLGVIEKSRTDISPEKKPRGRRINSDEIENCHECNRFCFPSMIMDSSDTPLCLNHALENLKEQKSSDYTLTSHLSLSDLNELVKEAEDKLHLIQTTPRKAKKRQAGVITSFEGNIKIPDTFE